MAGRVLVVEDDYAIARVVRRYLEQEGYAVALAGDGVTGLRHALAEPPDLIVLDWMLPGLDGPEFLRRLRERSAAPVIMLTARVEEADRVAGLELGADDYVTKPFSPRELVARVKAVLRRLNGPGAEGVVALVHDRHRPGAAQRAPGRERARPDDPRVRPAPLPGEPPR